jgi:hypothetical protein
MDVSRGPPLGSDSPPREPPCRQVVCVFFLVAMAWFFLHGTSGVVVVRKFGDGNYWVVPLESL